MNSTKKNSSFNGAASFNFISKKRKIGKIDAAAFKQINRTRIDPECKGLVGIFKRESLNQIVSVILC